MKLDITPVLSGKVRKMPFSYEIDVDGGDMPLPPEGVLLTSPIRVNGTISDSGSCLHLVLTANVDYKAECDRCADEINGNAETSLERLVGEEGFVSDENADDYFIAVDGALDLDFDVAEELMLAFPSRMLCREDCRGVCPDCGVNLNRESCDCEKKRGREVDPRWQGLMGLLEQDNDENKK